MRRILLPAIFLFLLPSFAFAEELLPAICRQVLEPANNTRVMEIVRNHIVERVKEIPALVVNDIKNAIDGTAGSLAERLENRKSRGLVLADGPGNRVLGISTANVSGANFLDSLYDKALGALAFLLRHWFWTIAAFGLIVLGWFLKF